MPNEVGFGTTLVSAEAGLDGSNLPTTPRALRVRTGSIMSALQNRGGVDGAVDQADADRVALWLTPPGGRCDDVVTACCHGDVDSDTDVDCDDWTAVESQWTDPADPVPSATCQAAPAVPIGGMPWLEVLLLVVGSVRLRT